MIVPNDVLYTPLANPVSAVEIDLPAQSRMILEAPEKVSAVPVQLVNESDSLSVLEPIRVYPHEQAVVASQFPAITTVEKSTKQNKNTSKPLFMNPVKKTQYINTIEPFKSSNLFKQRPLVSSYMNIFTSIIAFVLLYVLAQAALKGAPKKYQMFGIAIILGISLIFPFLLDALAQIISYSILIAATFVMMFTILLIFGQKKFGQYFKGGELRYWLGIAAFLIIAFSLSQMAGNYFLQHNTLTGASVVTANGEKIDAAKIMNTIFLTMIPLTFLVTAYVFKWK